MSNIEKIHDLMNKLDFLDSDKAVVEIIDCVEDLYLNSECYLLFSIFMNKIYDECIYLALLSSTLYFKNSLIRLEYLEFVRKELSKSYSDKKIKKILIGL